MNKRAIIAAVGAAALVIPAVASADSGHDRGQRKRTEGGAATTNDKRPAKKTKKVTLALRARSPAAERSASARAMLMLAGGGFLGQSVTFELAGARIVVADTNADQKVDLADVLAATALWSRRDSRTARSTQQPLTVRRRSKLSRPS